MAESGSMRIDSRGPRRAGGGAHTTPERVIQASLAFETPSRSMSSDE